MIATVSKILTAFTSRMTDDIAFMCLHAWPLAINSLCCLSHTYTLRALLACRVLDSKTLKGEVKAFVERVGEQHQQLHFV